MVGLIPGEVRNSDYLRPTKGQGWNLWFVNTAEQPKAALKNMTHFMLLVTIFVYMPCSKTPPQISLVLCQFRVSYASVLFIISSIYRTNTFNFYKSPIRNHWGFNEVQFENRWIFVFRLCWKAEAVKQTSCLCFRNHFWIFKNLYPFSAVFMHTQSFTIIPIKQSFMIEHATVV